MQILAPGVVKHRQANTGIAADEIGGAETDVDRVYPGDLLVVLEQFWIGPEIARPDAVVRFSADRVQPEGESVRRDEVGLEDGSASIDRDAVELLHEGV